jgi:hypothetical protein
MLLFSTTSITEDGVTVFPDHDPLNRNTFWYLSGPVDLATLPGSDEPQFLLIEYTPDVASSGVQGVGFLNVTVCLKLRDETHDKLMGRIRAVWPNADNPNLQPVPFDEGTVQIVALDLQGGGGTTNAATPGTFEAVEKILGASTPELFGDNDALFALTLSEDGASILKAAFEGGMAPVGAIYNMKFTGVRPALDVKITADLKRVYQSFSVGVSAKAYWVTAGIDATFEKLRQDGAIKIEVVNLAGDQADDDREKQALALFKDQILSTWFQPSLNASTAAAADASSVQTFPTGGGGTTTTTTTTKAGGGQSGGGQAGGGQTGAGSGAIRTGGGSSGVTGGGSALHSGGSGSSGGVTTARPPAVTSSSGLSSGPQRSVSSALQPSGSTGPRSSGSTGSSPGGGSGAPAVTSAPSTGPGGTAAPSGGGGTVGGSLTPAVGGSAPTSGGSAATGGGSPPGGSGGATAAKPAGTPGGSAGGGGTSTTTTTGPSAGSQAGGVANALAGAAANAASAASSAASQFGLSFKLKYVSQDEQKTVTYEYNRMDAIQRTYAPQGYFALLLNKLDRSKHFLEVDGTDKFFNKFSVAIAPPHDFAGIGLQTAHVAIDYGDPNAGQPKHGEFVFDAAHTVPTSWDVFQGQIQTTQFTYAADYAFDPEAGWTGEQDRVQLPPVQTENRQLSLDPYASLGFLSITLTPGRIDPVVVDRVEVALQYARMDKTDPDKTVLWQASNAVIVRGDSQPQTWKLRLSDPTQTAYTYSARTILKDGTEFSQPPVTTTARAIIVHDAFAGGIDVLVQPAFNASKTKAALIELDYQDAQSQYHYQNTLYLQATSAQPTRVHIPLLDRSQNAFSYRVSLVGVDDQQKTGTMVSTTNPVLLVGDSP